MPAKPVPQTSKVLNYLDSPIVIPYFIFFLCVWVYLRHYQNLRIFVSMLPLPSPFPAPITARLHTFFTGVESTLTPLIAPLHARLAQISPSAAAMVSASYASLFSPESVSQFAAVGPYELNWDTQQYKCWISQWITFWLLAALQAVNLFWLFLILRILWRVVATIGDEVRDERSEYDSEEEDERRVEMEKEKREEEREMRKDEKMGNGVVKH
jgi:very-long-chain ceramide synthase